MCCLNGGGGGRFRGHLPDHKQKHKPQMVIAAEKGGFRDIDEGDCDQEGDFETIQVEWLRQVGKGLAERRDQGEREKKPPNHPELEVGVHIAAMCLAQYPCHVLVPGNIRFASDPEPSVSYPNERTA